MENTFEEKMKRLDEIVTGLEKGETPLSEAMKMFEEGVKLTKEAQQMLSDAEGKIKVLTKNGLEDFIVEE